MTHKFLKIAGVKDEASFYKKFPTEEAFFKAFPQAAPKKAAWGASLGTDQFVGGPGPVNPFPKGFKIPTLDANGNPIPDNVISGNGLPTSPAWENSGELNPKPTPTIVDPNRPKTYDNPDYIPNVGEGQLNRGKLPNLTEGQRKYDQGAINPNANKLSMPEGQGGGGFTGQGILAGLNMASAFMGPDRKKRRYVRPEDMESYSPNTYGTGSQAISEYGDTLKGKKKAVWGAVIGAVAGGKGGLKPIAGLHNNINEAMMPLMNVSNQATERAQYLDNTDFQNIQNLQTPTTMLPGQLPYQQPIYNPNRTQYMEDGGEMKYNNGGELVTGEGGNTQLKSYNPFGGGTFQFNGDSHGKGGIDINYKGQDAEVEGGETAFKDKQGDLKIMGNLVNPLTGRKYKDDLKRIAKKEQKAQKFIDKGTLLLNTANPDDPFEALAFNAGKAMAIGGWKKQEQFSEIKEHLGNMQEAHLETAKEKKMSPEKLFRDGGTMYADGGTAGDPDPVLFVYKGKKYTREELQKVAGLSDDQFFAKLLSTKSGDPGGITRYETEYKRVSDGSAVSEYEINNYPPSLQKDMRKWIANGDYTLIPNDIPRYEESIKQIPATGQTSALTPINNTGDPIYEAMLKKAAEKYGVKYETIARLVEQESGFKPGTTSNVGAMGVMQFMPGTAKQYGLSKEQLLSKDPKDIEKQIEAGVKHFKGLLSKNNNDEILALAAYNAGQGTVDDFRKASKKKASEYTGQDLLERMEWKRANQPSDKLNLAQNQTYDYIKNVYAPVVPAEEFRKKYYEPGAPTDGMFSGKFTVPPFDYMPKPPAIQTVQGNGDPIDLKQPAPYDKPSNARGINPLQFLGEAYAMATNQEEPVPAQLYTPELFQPYQVSFQDRLNENQATFNSVEKQLAYDPTSLATLAGQKYSANSAVLADEFRTNQAIANDITNKNVSLLNETEKTNLGILREQYGRQSQAKSNTKKIDIDALSSVSSKMLQKEANNNMLRVYENLYPNYAFNKNSGKAEFYGPKPEEQIDWSGAQSITSGQPTKTVVKTDPTGKKTTTDTYEPFNPQLEPWKIKPKKSTYKPVSLTKLFRE